jgi:hypothetical protein
MRIGALVLAAMLCAGSPLVARPTIALHVSPMVAPAPATIRIRVTVPPHAENRSVAIGADSDAFFRSSEVALEGEKAPRNVIVEYRSLPSGIYEVRGVLVDARGEEVAATRSIVTATEMRPITCLTHTNEARLRSL